MKVYVKPDLFYESFELSHHIASCSVDDDDTKKMTNATNGTNCTYTLITGDVLFLESNDSCTTKNSVFEGYCYQTGTDGTSFFSS